MDCFPAQDTDTELEKLKQVVADLTRKHNDLVVSLSLLWSETQRSTNDPLTHIFCSKRLAEMGQLLHIIPMDDSLVYPSSLGANEAISEPPTSMD